MKLTRKILGGVSFWALFNPVLAMAQPQSPTPPGAAASASGLQDIIVTAQRRGENVQRVPISISAISADQLQTRGIATTADIKMAVASADVPVLNGYALPFIRGIGTKAAGPATESSVSTYVDNVYIGSSAATLLSFNNIARVEVLKGPQGTLFGRNATGGLISIVTRDPTDELQLNAHASYGNYDTVHTDLYVGGPVATGVKADFAAYLNRQGEGYGTNFLTGADVGRVFHDYGLRSKWLIESGALTAHIAADYGAMKSSAFVQRIATGYSAPPPYNAGSSYGGSPWDTNVTISPLLRTRGGGLSAKLDYDIGSAVTLTSITAWRKSRYHNVFDGDVTPTDGTTIDAIQTDEQFSQEIQLLSGPSSAFTWVVGAYLYDAQGLYDPVVRILTGPSSTGPFTGVGSSVTYARQDVFSLAPYAQGTLEIFDATRLTLGLRYTYEKRKQHGEATSFSPGALQVGPVTTIDQRLTAKKLTWRVALDHQFGPDILGYLSYNRGFKSGGANLTSVTAPMYQPEQLDAYEVGLKTTLFDRRVRFNTAAFYYDYKDIQVSSAAAGIISIYNGAQARTYGVEMDMDAQVTDQLHLNAGYTYLDAKFTRFPNAVVNTPNAAGGVRQVIGSAQGNSLPNAPKSVITAGASYVVELGANTLTFNGNMYHNSGFAAEPDNFRRQPSYQLYNASIDLMIADRWSLSLWGRNLSNEAVDLFPSVNGLGGGLGVPRSSYAPPRTYGVTIGVKI
jgi:iron complex outermembrane recepter protein